MKHHPKIRRPLENRILSLKNARDQIHDFQMTGHCVGLCHGCFDVLHFGHLRHFEAAAEVCDMLVVSVTADRFVNKGANRPVFHDRERAELLSGIYCVDFSVISEYPSAHNVLEYLKPTMFFKGSEYLYGPESVNPNFLEEKKFAESLGIKVLHTFEKTSSSTQIIEKIMAFQIGKQKVSR